MTEVEFDDFVYDAFLLQRSQGTTFVGIQGSVKLATT